MRKWLFKRSNQTIIKEHGPSQERWSEVRTRVKTACTYVFIPRSSHSIATFSDGKETEVGMGSIKVCHQVAPRAGYWLGSVAWVDSSMSCIDCKTGRNDVTTNVDPKTEETVWCLFWAPLHSEPACHCHWGHTPSSDVSEGFCRFSEGDRDDGDGEW